MLCKRTFETLNCVYAEAKRKKAVSTTISCVYPNIAIFCNERYQMTHPELGTVHAYTLFCEPLQKFCLRYRDYENSDTSLNAFSVTENLKEALHSVTFKRETISTKKDTYNTKIADMRLLYTDKVFKEMCCFLIDLKKWIQKNEVCFEPFQKASLMHIVFFLATIRAPQYSLRFFEYLRKMFQLEETSDITHETFKQKTTIFLVPRRHGKTWIIIPIISFLLKNYENISIGYVAHQKHICQHVLKEVRFLSEVSSYINKKGFLMYVFFL